MLAEKQELLDRAPIPSKTEGQKAIAAFLGALGKTPESLSLEIESLSSMVLDIPRLAAKN
jgi:hypothetical protein